jgi:hypothetical protein
MGVTIAELAGGLIRFAAQLIVLWAILESGCWLFFKIQKREKSGE